MEPELAEIRDFLAEHAPYSDLPGDVLDALPAQLRVRYHRRGSVVLRPEDVLTASLVIRSGALDVRDGSGALVDRLDVGESVGVSGVLSARPYGFEVSAAEDTLVLTVPGAVLRGLLAHAPVATFFIAQQSDWIREAVAGVSEADRGGAVLRTRLSDMVRREPLTTRADSSIRDAAALMREHRVSSLLVVDEEGHLAGIVTDRDLRNRVVAEALDVAAPVGTIMTRDPISLPPDALALEAMLEMMTRGIHHLPLVLDGRTVGVVTSTDIIRLEQSSPLYLAREVENQTDIEGLAGIVGRLPELVEGLVAQDALASDITRVVSLVGDGVQRRLIQMAHERFGDAPVPYCWVVLGSQARYESALRGDQDTALILDDGVTPEQQAWFAEFAAAVTDGLEQVGYPRCPGEIMAANPRWRQTEQQWRRTFATWIDEPTPDALVSASIFFDMRPIAGDAAMAERLLSRVLARTPQAGPFLAHLIKQAVQRQPPLGLFRGLVVERGGDHKSHLDLKHRGVGPVVEMGRVHGLAVGARAVDTRGRLEAARAVGRLTGPGADDLLGAFEYISHVRLQHQVQRVRAGEDPDNFLAPDTLTSFEKRTLKDAFAVVRTAQTALGQRVPLGFMS